MADSISEKKPKTRVAPPPSVKEQRVLRDGKLVMLRKVDLASPTFGEDMLYVFRKNVEAARRENERVTGVADVEPGKR